MTRATQLWGWRWWPDAGAPSRVLRRMALGLSLETSLTPCITSYPALPSSEGVPRIQDF